jgi:hypothetical protein
MKTPTAIAALIVASISLAALPAFAQDAGSSSTPPPPASPSAAAPATPDHGPGGRGHMRLRGPMAGDSASRPFAMLALACSDRGAGALEKMLDRSARRLDLSADQQKLFDAFRTKALTAQTGFADACKAARPDRTAQTRPDLLDRVRAGLAVDQARLTALNEVFPDFEALYNSLSDQQKQHLLPRAGRWDMHRAGPGMMHGGKGGPDRNGPPPPRNS